ncbi:MAG: hypothetical protein FD153_1098 [Rhodospirillaceae bacterium]|nr:MAG: hypothetical protein FD153_1098 [Rhodospirillaceae bacterium]
MILVAARWNGQYHHPAVISRTEYDSGKETKTTIIRRHTVFALVSEKPIRASQTGSDSPGMKSGMSDSRRPQAHQPAFATREIATFHPRNGSLPLGARRVGVRVKGTSGPVRWEELLSLPHQGGGRARSRRKAPCSLPDPLPIQGTGSRNGVALQARIISIMRMAVQAGNSCPKMAERMRTGEG